MTRSTPNVPHYQQPRRKRAGVNFDEQLREACQHVRRYFTLGGVKIRLRDVCNYMRVHFTEPVLPKVVRERLRKEHKLKAQRPSDASTSTWFPIDVDFKTFVYGNPEGPTA